MLLECVKCICVGSESTPSQDTTETLMNIYVTFLNLVSSGCWFFAVVLINTSLQHQHRAGLHYSSSVVGLQVEQKQATESWKGLLLFFFFFEDVRLWCLNFQWAHTVNTSISLLIFSLLLTNHWCSVNAAGQDQKLTIFRDVIKSDSSASVVQAQWKLWCFQLDSSLSFWTVRKMFFLFFFLICTG